MSWHSDDLGLPQPRPADAWENDEVLAADLARAVATEETLRRVTSAASTAFVAHRGMLALREELATDLLLLSLVHDSCAEDRLSGVRDRTGRPSRTLVFEGDGVGVEVELTDGLIEGQLIPARPGRVELRRPDGGVGGVETDEVGYFRLEARTEGPVRLVCETTDGTCVTEWLPW
ncbi:hypothetical protein J1G42_06555 [Cellulomonas sp. zg-ZUI222]|uniref:Carboxypeptidase regulatory-like domain-containing protein n=1 Tax=Cellulomonas wangleii TaxID=2816956 RepID=A0ABX8D203_9CELL|nr:MULTISPECIES: hypothetical protein [Cellulomonas]MBO0899619.1 hypothetical protein [Cellulomonas sp. zg-ZUI22]MBO0920481.1 hypothetical protein [Cellulomonas wangleii]MBO0923101.1 hypothetical protein [Cellulomonas wangleii]QVI61483.1 hypothetical protein KG103_13485 [Cellulomonas wangleii]